MAADLNHRISRLEAAERRRPCRRCSDPLMFLRRQALEDVVTGWPIDAPERPCSECGQFPELIPIESLRRAVAVYDQAVAAGLIPPGYFDGLYDDPERCQRLLEEMDADEALNRPR